MIVVTGAAGFIGSNLVKALNGRGITDIIAVDNLTRGDKFVNLADCDIADYLDKESFLSELEAGAFDGAVDAVLHEGACSDTTESDGRYMMQNNYRYSRALLDYCISDEVPLIYASSAAVYGASQTFRETRECEGPLNVYGYSKFLFDQVVRRNQDELSAQVVGLRYFNVYGGREQHKTRMASVAFHFFNQYRSAGSVRLFEGSAAMATAISAATSCRSRTWSKSTCFSSTTPGNPGFSTSAPAQRKASMTWPWPPSTPAARRAAGRRCRWLKCSSRA